MKKGLKSLLNKTVFKHKFGAVKTICLYGHVHASKKEALWCLKLQELYKERKISCLENQPVFELNVNNVLVCKHTPDFYYLKVIDTGETIKEVVEVKGFKTPDWRLKHKLFCALYPDINYVVV